METWGWLGENWFNLLNAGGIIGGLCFTAVSLHSEAKTRRIANLLTMIQNHHELLKVFYKHLDLKRIFDPSADTATFPISRGEEVYVNVMIQHLFSVYEAMQSDLTIRPERIERDVREFFMLPIPRIVWEKIKLLQNSDFVQFVESCLPEKSAP